MTSAQRYRALAADCEARAIAEKTGSREEWQRLALSYRRLAEQAERSSCDELAYEVEQGRDRMTPKS